MKGVILAAGYATRFLPASKTIPKEMFPLIDRPAIDFIVQEMNREVNTFGAKADGLGVSELIINAKAELEKMREQREA